MFGKDATYLNNFRQIQLAFKAKKASLPTIKIALNY